MPESTSTSSEDTPFSKTRCFPLARNALIHLMFFDNNFQNVTNFQQVNAICHKIIVLPPCDRSVNTKTEKMNLAKIKADLNKFCLHFKDDRRKWRELFLQNPGQAEETDPRGILPVVQRPGRRASATSKCRGFKSTSRISVACYKRRPRGGGNSSC